MQISSVAQLNTLLQELDHIQPGIPLESELTALALQVFSQLQSDNFSWEEGIYTSCLVARLTYLHQEEEKLQPIFSKWIPCASMLSSVSQLYKSVPKTLQIPIDEALELEQALSGTLSERQDKRSKLKNAFYDSSLDPQPAILTYILKEFSSSEGTLENDLPIIKGLSSCISKPSLIEVQALVEFLRVIPANLKTNAEDLLADILIDVRKIDPKVREHLIKAFSLTVQNLSLDRNSILPSAKQLRRELHEQLSKILIELEKESKTDLILGFLEFFLNSGFLFGISQDHLLVRKSLQVLVQMDPHFAQNRNSLHLHYINFIRHDTSQSASRTRLFSSQRVSPLSKNLSLPILTFSYDLLPPSSFEYSSEIFTNAFESLRTKLSTLYIDHQRTLHPHHSLELWNLSIQPIFEDIITYSKMSFGRFLPDSNNTTRLYKWLRFSTIDGVSPPLPVAQLHWIAKALQEKSEEPSVNSFLSAKELFFLEFLVELHRHPHIEEEGISAFYHKHFPLEFIPDASQEVQGLFSFFVQHECDRRRVLLSEKDSPFLREILEFELEPFSFIFQTIYLKNLLAKELGVPHALTINPICTEKANPKLREMTKQEIQNLFFSYYTKESLIQSFLCLWEKVKTSELSQSLKEFAVKNGTKDPKTLFKEGSSQNSQTLTAGGVQTLLQYAGFLLR